MTPRSKTGMLGEKTMRNPLGETYQQKSTPVILNKTKISSIGALSASTRTKK